MTILTDRFATTSADELPPSGFVTLLRESLDADFVEPVATYFVVGNISEEFKRDYESDWAERFFLFVNSLSPTSAKSGLVLPLEDDDHPLAPTAQRVRRLHDQSGLTWQQLARALGVSRRSIHAWAAGGRINARNMERLGRVEGVINGLSDPTAAGTRERLMRPDDSGVSAYQALITAATPEPIQPRVDPAILLTSSGEGPNVPGAATPGNDD